LREYGEERGARRIARAIVRRRQQSPLRGTADLAAVVRQWGSGRKPVSSLARVFQGVRVWVNGELENLRQGLERSLGVLAPGSILVVLSYHSLEDRMVKQFFRRQVEGCVCPPALPRCGCGFVPGFRLLTRRALRPDAAEVAHNVRARSARLRALQRTP
jgi:16S rRNA (cytosine1402-N4)-methyltransferase